MVIRFAIGIMWNLGPFLSLSPHNHSSFTYFHHFTNPMFNQQNQGIRQPSQRRFSIPLLPPRPYHLSRRGCCRRRRLRTGPSYGRASFFVLNPCQPPGNADWNHPRRGRDLPPPRDYRRTAGLGNDPYGPASVGPACILLWPLSAYGQSSTGS